MLIEPTRGIAAAVPDDRLFPRSQRSVFNKSPLLQVIGEFKFPQILLIESSVPSQFQERIRGKFPIFQRISPISMPQIPNNLASLVGPGANPIQYHFSTEDQRNTLQLSSNAISLSTRKYTRWEDFWTLFAEPLNALKEIYRPAFFVRVGLRYLNAIVRSQRGLANVPWSQLLRSELLGELSIPAFENNLDSVAQRQLQLRLPEGNGAVLLRHGLGYVITPPNQPELSYMIDFDFSKNGKTELKDGDTIIGAFHEFAGDAFRWAISDTLRDTLEPIPPGD
jgi:uncharacterized protein (TIGR04255 family)